MDTISTEEPYTANGSVSKSLLFDDISVKNLKYKIPWYYGPACLIFWLVLFLAVVLPAFYQLPNSLSLKDEPHNPGKFVAEYAQRILYKFDQIGPKVVGSYANENKTVQLILDEIGKIRDVMNTDLFDMEIDRQQVSGAHIYWTMINMYQGVQNIVVKLSTKGSKSDAFLLVNSHFDSKPGTPGTGDDGFMVVVMLETLRQIAKSNETFEHSIIFLFNGGEENSLQASHGFITQHKWAKQCRALINLDAAGSGGREMLFQSGPKNNWLMSYYNKNVKHPFATSLAEEIFQSGLIPSDTDFRIFKEFGGVPGLDFAQIQNGYVYHTKFDSYDVIPRRSIQSTGDNILSLVRALANAEELYDTEKHIGGHAVFFDYLGLFFLYYTETTAVIVNCIVSVASLAIIGYSLWRITANSKISIYETSLNFGIIFAIQLLAFILAYGFPLLLAVIFDAANQSLTWFTNIWLVIGLYICPSLLGLALPFVLYLTYTHDTTISHTYRIQMALHAHCTVLCLLCIILTCVGLRSVYVLMITISTYSISLLINLLSSLHDRKYYWAILHSIFQIFPFLYSYYVTYTWYMNVIPMMGRNGSDLNPDLLVAFFSSLGTGLAMGFLIPLVNIFRRSKLLLGLIGGITIIFIILAVTPVGFPYRAALSVHRVNFLHTERVFYEYDGTVSLNESGYLFDYQDRRKERPLIGTDVNLSGLRTNANDCKKYMMCGMPLYNHRWVKGRANSGWLPRDNPVQIPDLPISKLELLEKVIGNDSTSIRYEFQLSGPSHMSIFLQPLEGVTLIDWSFLAEGLEPKKLPIPYHIFFTYGNDPTPLKFFFKFKSDLGSFEHPLFELGISAHYINAERKPDPDSIEFIADFPNYVNLMEWPSSYKRYIF